MRIDPELKPRVLELFFQLVDEYCAQEGADIADVLMEFKMFEREGIKGLYERMNKKHPYDKMTKMEESTDSERTKIKRIVHKM